MKTIRTPKAGETWIWMPCDKHRFKQLRDVVLSGVNFEDQPEFNRQWIMEHVVCGCQYPADDPEAAIVALRIDEARHEAEMRFKIAEITMGAYYPQSSEVSPWWAVAVILVAIGAAMYFCVFRH
jgi:hypothetical protein